VRVGVRWCVWCVRGVCAWCVCVCVVWLKVTGSDDETLRLFDTRFPSRCLTSFHGHR
jgi:hypothetical protein